MTVLVSTHYMDEAEHCDRVGLMNRGRLIAIDNPARLRADAEQRFGRILAIEADRFADAFLRLRNLFPDAMLYGRRIQWQSKTPDADQGRTNRLLADCGIKAQIGTVPVTMEDAFAAYLREGGTDV
jgi:ABC-2 type transport system ATP-binding protein